MLPENPFNGGFPEPPAGAPVRVVTARHEACGASTRVRLPETLPVGAVRRCRCSGCAGMFEPPQVEEIGPEPVVGAEHELTEWVESIEPEVTAVEAAERKLHLVEPGTVAPSAVPRPVSSQPRPMPTRHPRLALPKVALPKLSLPKLPAVSLPKPKLPVRTGAARRLPKLPSPRLPALDPESRSWKLLSIPIAAVLVVGGLILLRGSEDEPAPVAPAAPAASAQLPAAGSPTGADDRGSGAASGGKPSKETEFVRESSYSLALPAGWERIDPPAGATFAAVAADGSADATLWITQDPKLDFPTFVSQSLTQLEALAGAAEVIERIPGPTAETTIVRLAADAPAGQPTYEATLRVAGPYRYYLATTVQPGSSAATADGIELITGSLNPELEG